MIVDKICWQALKAQAVATGRIFVLLLCFFYAFAGPASQTKSPTVKSESGGQARSSINTGLTNQEAEQRFKSLKILSDVLNVVEKSYIQKLSAKQLIQGAVKGVLRELDPHSHFLSAEELKTFQKQSKGRFVGLGIELAIKNKQVIVISVLENSPARRAGIKAGDILLTINQQKTANLNKAEIYKLLSVRKGEKARISLKDLKSGKVSQVELSPALISVQSVSHKNLNNQFLYIRVNAFTERTSMEIRKIIGSSVPAGLILDLRGNPGGLFESAVKTVDLFLKKGVIVRIEGRNRENKQIFRAQAPGTLPDFPMMVLIDGYSASSAEILAGALKENKRAVLLGRTSFGKGSVQSLIPISHENAVKLTVAHYLTPKGHIIHEQGIRPHIELKKPVPADELKGLLWTGPEDTDFKQAFSFLKTFKRFGFVSGRSADL